MGQVVPFIARVRDSGDWSAGERARLETLADQLAASGVHVEVLFGATDEGDPWCVVTDENGDVLIHVARIGGTFVVHAAVDDSVTEADDLHAALRDQLAATEDALVPREAVVLPFGMTARQGQGFLALVAAAAFFYETAGVVDTAQAAELPHAAPVADDPPPPPADTDKPEQDRQVATQAAAQHIDAQPAPTTPAEHAEAEAPAAAAAPEAPLPPPEPLQPQARAASEPVSPTPVAQAQDAPILIQGTAGDDSLVGTAANEHILGGAGNDTLVGGGGHDTLEGGAGADRIEITADSLAIGGAGADTFVIQLPAHPGFGGNGGLALLGVVLDFNGLDGDRLVNSRGGPVTQVGSSRPGDSPPQHDFGLTTSLRPTEPLGPPEPIAWTRLDVDLDGDGKADGYVLLADGRGGVITNLHDDVNKGPHDPVLVVVDLDLSCTTFFF